MRWEVWVGVPSTFLGPDVDNSMREHVTRLNEDAWRGTGEVILHVNRMCNMYVLAS